MQFQYKIIRKQNINIYFLTTKTFKNQNCINVNMTIFDYNKEERDN